MNNNRSWSSIGEELRDAVGKALEDGDFTTLGDAAVNTMSDTLKNVETLVQQAVNNTAIEIKILNKIILLNFFIFLIILLLNNYTPI